MSETKPSFNDDEGESSPGKRFEPGNWWTDFLVAMAFLTRIPIDVAWEDGTLARAFRAFPFAGMIIGAVGGAVYWLATALGLTGLLAGFATILVSIVLTGGLHEDGLADMSDGFGGGHSIADKLRIMRDSHIGSYGMLALVLSVGIRVSAMAAIAVPELVFATLVAAGALSRGVMPALMTALPMARSDGLAVSAYQPTNKTAILAVVLAAVIALLFLDLLYGLAAIIFGVWGAIFTGWLARRQIGGYTGDVVGAAQQITEGAVLVTVVALI